MNKIIILLLITIICPKSYSNGRVLGDGNWGTHIAPLVTVIMNTNGPILEMGCGDYSTTILHALCSPTKRILVTAEMDHAWQAFFLDLKKSWHSFIKVEDYNAWDKVGNDRYWSVVFIDQRPGERRIIDMARLRSNTDVFVVHDTEDDYYGYEPLLSSFKYRYDYTRYKVKTTVVSDVVDVQVFFK